MPKKCFKIQNSTKNALKTQNYAKKVFKNTKLFARKNIKIVLTKFLGASRRKCIKKVSAFCAEKIA